MNVALCFAFSALDFTTALCASKLGHLKLLFGQDPNT